MQRLRPTRRDDGAAAVEAALLFPILVILVFGMIEFSLVLRDYVATTSLVRVGARVASAEPRLGTTAACATTTPTDACFAQDAADAIQQAGSALPKNSIDYIYVYLANKNGFPSQSAAWQSDTTSNFNTCNPTYCYKYTWVPGVGSNPGRFRWSTGAWNPQAINVCQIDATNPNGEQSVGVYMKVSHNNVTGLFGKKFTMTDYAVNKFEPRSVSEGCK